MSFHEAQSSLQRPRMHHCNPNLIQYLRTTTQTVCDALTLLHQLSSSVGQASPAHAQCALPVRSTAFVHDRGQSQILLFYAGVFQSMLSEDVAQLLREGQSVGRET